MLDQLNKSGDVESCRHTLAIASVVRRPLGALRDIVELCGSFLFLRDDKVYFIHQSAQDFLLGGATTVFPSGVEEVHYGIFSKSLNAMSQTLWRDIYGLRAPGWLISDVTPPCPDPLATLRYSCVHWVDHLCASGRKDALHDHDLVHTFLEKKYIY